MTTGKKSLALIGVLALFLAALSGCAGETGGVPDEDHWAQAMDAQRVLSAKIISIDNDELKEDEGGDYQLTLFTAEITKGPLKGSRIAGRMTSYTFTGYRVVPLKPGNHVFLQPVLEDSGPMGEFADYDRTWGVIAIVLLFAVVLCLVGGLKGFRSLVALIVTCLGLAFIFIPWVSNGGSPIGASLLVCALVAVACLLIIGGVGVKTISSLLGIMIGVLTSGLLVAIMQMAMKLTGIVDSDTLRLTQIPGLENLNMNGLMFAAILIGALGASMDMAYSLASALEELCHKANLSGLELVRSGMKIGRDMMGTMTNTLVLAYVGGSLHLVMLLAADLSQFGYVLSWELIATEILRAMAGSIGLIVIVPATSLISALLYKRGHTAENPFS